MQVSIKEREREKERANLRENEDAVAFNFGLCHKFVQHLFLSFILERR